jgi:outer membrane protein OmpA-like peptidoglycan-associated protein
MFFGRQEMPEYGNPKIKYSVNNDEDISGKRTIDARAEQMERIFEELKNSAIAIPKNITAEKANFSLANVHFLPGKAELNESSKKFLTEFCRDLQYSTDTKPGILYVLGLASEEKDERDQWLLSAIRAEIVAKFLRNNLISNQYNTSDIFDSPPKWSVYSLGAGQGIDWTGINNSNSQILIAVQKTTY